MISNNNNNTSLQTKVLADARRATNEYKTHEAMVRDFVENFSSHDTKDPRWGGRKYMANLQKVVDRKAQTMWIDLADVEKHFENEEQELLKACVENTKVYLNFFYDACSQLFPPKSEGAERDDVEEWYKKLVQNNEEAQIPAHVKCKFLVRFLRGNTKPTMMRQIGSSNVGGYVVIQGTVTRNTPVRPRVDVAAYQCNVCLQESYQVVEGETYAPMNECPSDMCKQNKSMGNMQPILSASKLVRCQELSVQEPAREVPTGNVPRTVRVVLIGDNTRTCKVGDGITLGGVYTPVVRAGFAAMKKGPLCEMQFEAHHVQVQKTGESDLISADIEAKIAQEARDGDMYERLAESLAPEIFGHEDIKKALILMLVGGVTRKKEDGMKIRGDMHMLLMGDPGVAKSQLLKHVCLVAPRSVYTSGKGSSSVGLTAAIIRDPTTSEVTLEGGALVMADKGLCAIDEFDKMDEADRASIHEVMEQQTVSIAKAGISTSLNARASVVAAANPIYGRYNLNLPLIKNVALPESLLSRFDLHFILIDKHSADADFQLARHVGHVHQYKKAPGGEADVNHFDGDFIRAYISCARQYEPTVDTELMLSMVNFYAQLRSNERAQVEDERKGYTSPRTLLALLRMSQARARLRLSPRVELHDFEEACRLMEASKESCAPDDGGEKRRVDVEGAIFNVICAEGEKFADGEWMSLVNLERVVLNRGYTRKQLDDVILTYRSLDVLEVMGDMVRFAKEE